MTFEVMGESGVYWCAIGRVALFYWVHPRVWSIGAHWRSCCALNIMLGPFELMVRPAHEDA